MTTTFHERLRALRKERHIRQTDLAEAVGIDHTYLSKVENGRMEPPSVKVIEWMAQELNVDSTELLTLAGKVPPDVRAIVTSCPQVSGLLRAAQWYTPADWDCLAMLVRGETTILPKLRALAPASGGAP